jgi:UDP-N-acetylmuramoyl-L-alanyl-D-glutamate--2,6-diaminopimelate ligase
MVMVDLERLVERLGGDLEAPGSLVPGALVPGSKAGQRTEVLDVELDSRRVEAGALFCALPGTRADGARFVDDAVARGAAAILTPGRLAGGAPVPSWVHPDARRVAGMAASICQGEPSRELFVAAVTGTNGKTTTAHLIGELLAACGRVPAVLGTAGHRLAGPGSAAGSSGERLPASHTTPDAPELQRLLARHRAAGGDSVALEMSSHALDQERHAGLDIDAAVFLNLSRDHLDYHGDMEQYAAAKERLFAALRPGGHAIDHVDDPASHRMARAARRAGAEVHTISARSRADLWASRLQADAGGSFFTVVGMGISTRVRLSAPGRFNVENALAALAVVLTSGASPSSALEGLATASPAPGRLEPVPGARGFRVLVDFAHTEDALARVLDTLRAVTAGRLICVFGAGGDRDPGKRAPMGRAVGERADLAIVTSDNPRGEDPARIADEVEVGLVGTAAAVERVLDRRLAIRRALEAAREGDVVLVAGKGHETTQELGGRKLAFDDRRVVAELLAELQGGR